MRNDKDTRPAAKGFQFIRAALLVCTGMLVGLSACGDKADTEHSPVGSDNRSQERDPWKEGIHYSRIDSSDTIAAEAQGQVIEIFSYGCSRCFLLEPRIALWERNKPENISFVRVPATLQATHRGYARLYYTLQALGRDDLHYTVFDTVHRLGRKLVSDTDDGTRDLQAEFARSHGIATEDFIAAYQSTKVIDEVNAAEQQARKYRVDRTPTIIINGKYKTDVESVGDERYLFSVINDLALRRNGE